MSKKYGYDGQNRNRSFAPPSAIMRPSTDPNIMNGLNPAPIKRLRLHPVDETKECKGVEPREVTPVSSYNWTNDEEPTILVPGCPPIWQNKPTPFRLPRDTGVSFIDQNRHRVPQHPLLPLFLAVDHRVPDFDFSSIDIVTDRNNLRKLLRWINSTISQDFRIDLQLAGSTVLFTRFESLRVEFDSGRLGYGRNFEQYTTKRLAGCENSTGHHRIINYNFGELNLLVRFEVDACLYHDKETQQRKVDPRDMRPIPGDDPVDLLSGLRRMSIRSDDKIEIISRGVLVPQSSLVELGTKSEQSVASGIDWQEYLPQLYISQTPHHYLGVHERGNFRRIIAHTLNDDFLSAEKRKQQASYDKLHVVLQEIKDLVVSHGKEERLSLVYLIETKTLQVFSRKSNVSVLPDKWLGRFELSTQEAEDNKDEFPGGLDDKDGSPAASDDKGKGKPNEPEAPGSVSWDLDDSDEFHSASDDNWSEYSSDYEVI